MNENTDATLPASRHKRLPGSSIAECLKAFHQALSEAIARIDSDALERALATMTSAARAGNTIFSCGNGGSAAIAEHLACDWMKAASSAGDQTLRVVSLNSNMALLSAIANDFSYAQVFAMQLKMLGKTGDLVVLISSSGNSANIVEAALMAKRLGLTTIGMTGFSGGTLKEMADIGIHVPVDNYGVVEVAHQAVMHELGEKMARATWEADSDGVVLVPPPAGSS